MTKSNCKDLYTIRIVRTRDEDGAWYHAEIIDSMGRVLKRAQGDHSTVADAELDARALANLA